MSQPHWISELHVVEFPHVTTELNEDFNSQTKVSIIHRHATTISWNCKNLNSNSNIVHGPRAKENSFSRYHRSISRTYLYLPDLTEAAEINKGMDKGDDGKETSKCQHVQSIQTTNERYFVQLRWPVTENFQSQ